MKSQETIIPCPNCRKGSVKALYTPGYLGHTISGFGKKTIKYHRVPQRYEILSGCKNCGKTRKELIKIEKEGKPIDHEKRLKQWKKSGLPMVIESKPKKKRKSL